MKVYRITNLAGTWWAEIGTEDMKTQDNQTICQLRSKYSTNSLNPTDIAPEIVALGLWNQVGRRFTEIELKTLCTAKNWNLTMYYDADSPVTKNTALNPAAAPTNVVLAVGSAEPVGGVVNVAIPASGETNSTGAVTGWATGTADKIKITVTNAASTASTITINGDTYTSGQDYTIAAAEDLTVVLTTTRSGYATTIRTFIISVTAAE